ncbi:MAG: type II toxin-antitoxin system VapC family toxin [Gemmataceae bacterium]|nr:type II toxin-antitoxin system VapC family toxin [Gemmataceae bacterium]
MSLYVLDTDILTLYQHGHPAIRERVARLAPAQLAITVISVEEQLSGWYTLLCGAKKPAQLAGVYERLAQAVKTLAGLGILSFPEPAIGRYEELKAQKLNVAKMDLRIAAITLEHGGILVTRNMRDFQRVPGLVIEDWTA